MKKLFSVLLACALLLGTAACASSESTAPKAEASASSAEPTSTPSATPEPVTEEEKQDKMECGRVQIDWLTCDDHWSNTLRYYIKKISANKAGYTVGR